MEQKKKELEWNWKVIICKKQIVFHFEIMSEWASEKKWEMWMVGQKKKGFTDKSKFCFETKTFSQHCCLHAYNITKLHTHVGRTRKTVTNGEHHGCYWKCVWVRQSKVCLRTWWIQCTNEGRNINAQCYKTTTTSKRHSHKQAMKWRIKTSG